LFFCCLDQIRSYVYAGDPCSGLCRWDRGLPCTAGDIQQANSPLDLPACQNLRCARFHVCGKCSVISVHPCRPEFGLQVGDSRIELSRQVAFTYLVKHNDLLFFLDASNAKIVAERKIG
jgi:hypothetical protein